MLQNPEKSKTSFCPWPTILIFSVTGQSMHIYPATLLLGMCFSPDSIFLAYSAPLFFAFRAINPARSLGVIKADAAAAATPQISCLWVISCSSITWGPFAAAVTLTPHSKPAVFHFRH